MSSNEFTSILVDRIISKTIGGTITVLSPLSFQTGDSIAVDNITPPSGTLNINGVLNPNSVTQIKATDYSDEYISGTFSFTMPVALNTASPVTITSTNAGSPTYTPTQTATGFTCNEEGIYSVRCSGTVNSATPGTDRFRMTLNNPVSGRVAFSIEVNPTNGTANDAVFTGSGVFQITSSDTANPFVLNAYNMLGAGTQLTNGDIIVTRLK